MKYLFVFLVVASGCSLDASDEEKEKSENLTKCQEVFRRFSPTKQPSAAVFRFKNSEDCQRVLLNAMSEKDPLGAAAQRVGSFVYLLGSGRKSPSPNEQVTAIEGFLALLNE